MQRDKLVVECVLILVLFLILYAFSGDLSSAVRNFEDATDVQPVRAFFWFFATVFDWFGNALFCSVSYLVICGALYLYMRVKK
jgi:hypothetical protein